MSVLSPPKGDCRQDINDDTLNPFFRSLLYLRAPAEAMSRQPAIISLFVHKYTYIHTCMHTYIHTCIHIYIHAYIHTCIRTYIRTYIHAYIQTNIHAYIHRYKNFDRLKKDICQTLYTILIFFGLR